MRNIQDVLHEKEAEVEKLTREVKMLRVAKRILEDESPREDESRRQPQRATEPMPQSATTAIIHFEEGTVLPMADDDVLAGSSTPALGASPRSPEALVSSPRLTRSQEHSTAEKAAQARWAKRKG